jgi:hypothetical protein
MHVGGNSMVNSASSQRHSGPNKSTQIRGVMPGFNLMHLEYAATSYLIN